MYPLSPRKPKSKDRHPFKNISTSKITEMPTKNWMDEVESKKKGWSRDPNGGWIRERPNSKTSSSYSSLNGLSSDKSNGYSTVPTKLMPKMNSNLWNRRRTSSTTSIPSLSSNGGNHDTHSISPQTTAATNSDISISPTLPPSFRGSSASPRMPHTKGFWVQEPDDIHQRWIRTNDTPLEEVSPSSVPSPQAWSSPGVGSGCHSVFSNSDRPLVTSQAVAPQPHTTVGSAPVPKVYKSHATWVSGDGESDVLDFRNRFKKFQPNQSVSSTRNNNNAGCSSQPLKRPQLGSSANHSLSSSNLSESSTKSTSLKSTAVTKSSSNLCELKEATSKSSNLSELKSSISEAKSNISEMTAQTNSLNFSRSMSKSSTMQQSSSSTTAATTNTTNCGNTLAKLTSGLKSMSSLDALNMASAEDLTLADVTKDLDVSPLGNSSSPLSSQKELKFQEKKVTSSSTTKVVTDKNSFESASDHKSESRKLQSGDVSYEESSKIAASKSKLEMDGITAEKAAAVQEEAKQLRAGDVTHREGSQVKGAAMKISGDGYSAHTAAVSQQQQRQTVTPSGTISQEKSRKTSKSGLTINSNGTCTNKSSVMTSSQNNISITGFEDLDLGDLSQPIDISKAIMKFSATMSTFVDQLKSLTPENGMNAPSLLENINNMMVKAWSVPTYGHELGSSLCNVLRHNGGLDVLLKNCTDEELKYPSAKVLEQCLTTENRGYVVEKALDTVVSLACDCTQKKEQSKVGTGILEHLFKHSEGTCSDIIELGGLDAVLAECRNTDKDTLLHCAGALANLSLYGGSENHQSMMKQKVDYWLFPLAFHEDDNIKYYACLAIAALVANKEIEAYVTKSCTLSLIEPFVNSHIPEKFAHSTEAHRHGQSKSWLQKLIPVLSSKREEACNLAAFHFCMEASIKKNQGNLNIFREIGAIEPLIKVASSPFSIASKYAAEALYLIGEAVPHKLTPQVPLWSSEDVKEWVKQIGFANFSEAFAISRVDGDLLLKLTDDNLEKDIGMNNGILRQRFLRDLRKLKRMTDYSSCDGTGLNEFLIKQDPEFAEYTYGMLQAKVTTDYLRYLTDEQLYSECNILNSIHRQLIRNAIKMQDQENIEKQLDAFISYRRSNGSQLASLLKVHLSLRGLSAYIDVERLEAGKFDNNLINSVRQAKHFLLILTSNALDRCVGDEECKDWVHREIVTAIESKCNIIPILDNFQWPDPQTLPEDMRSVCYFNGIRWIHDYQEACVDKLERFMFGECRDRSLGGPSGGFATPGTPSTIQRAPIYQRTASIESYKGLSSSDRDLSKD